MHRAPFLASKELGPFYEEYSNQIVQTIVQQLPVLYNTLEECGLFQGKAEGQIGVNRRLNKGGKVYFAPNESGYYDTHTPFVVVHLKRQMPGFLWLIMDAIQQVLALKTICQRISRVHETCPEKLRSY